MNEEDDGEDAAEEAETEDEEDFDFEFETDSDEEQERKMGGGAEPTTTLAAVLEQRREMSAAAQQAEAARADLGRTTRRGPDLGAPRRVRQRRPPRCCHCGEACQGLDTRSCTNERLVVAAEMGLAEVVPIRLWRHLARRQVVAFMYAAGAERGSAARLLAGVSAEVLEQVGRTLGCLSTRLRPRDRRPTPALRRALAEACAEELPAELLYECLDVSLRSGQMEAFRLFWQVRRRVARTTLSCGARLCPGAKLSVSIGLRSGVRWPRFKWR